MLFHDAGTKMAISGNSENGDGYVRLGTDPPSPPPDASFALVIEFQKNTSDPGRVFQAADAMIRALQGLDHTLCAAIDSQIEPIMLLEDIEAGSIKAWLSNQLTRMDDEGIKKLDRKAIVGSYLVEAKYAVIRWSNKETKSGSLVDLSNEIKRIAQETDVKHLPDYAPPSLQDLSAGAKKIDEAKQALRSGDRMYLESAEAGNVEFNLTIRWSPEDLDQLAIKETTKFDNMPMTMIVKRPDYLGRSKWDFRFGKKAISARIDDDAWLISFQSRQIDIRPGDALKCRVTIEHKYGYDNELLDEEYTISKVEGVAENQLKQSDLPL